MPVASGGDSLVAHSSYELWTYSGTLPLVNPSFRLPTSTVHSFVTYCDNAVSGRPAGCKAPTDRWAPTVPFSLLKYPYIGAADRQAQNAGAPGAPSSGRPLTRTTNPAVQTANNNVACDPKWTRPPGKSCDEYPYASTLEGAASSPSNGMTPTSTPQPCKIPVARTSRTPVWESCFVPETENSSQGGVLSTFYSNNRVLNNDHFWVSIVP